MSAEVGGDGNQFHLSLGAPSAGCFYPLGESYYYMGITHAGNMVAGCGEFLVYKAAAHGDNSRAALCKGDDCFHTLSGDVVVVAGHEVPLGSAGDSVLQGYSAVIELKRLGQIRVFGGVHFSSSLNVIRFPIKH